jgi:hypothetical protein
LTATSIWNRRPDEAAPPCPSLPLNQISQQRLCGIEADDGGRSLWAVDDNYRCHGYKDGQNLQVNSSSSLIWFNLVSIFSKP